MSQHTTGMSRRRAMALASASIAGVALPSWPMAAVAAVEPVAPLVPVVRNPLISEGLSQLFRNRECWLRKHWNQYLCDVEGYRTVPDVGGINSRRWYFELMVSQVVRTVPATQKDREVKEYAHRLVLALLADFPEVPWWEDVAAKLEKCCAWHAAGGDLPQRSKSHQDPEPDHSLMRPG